jgi:hypothetical protein
MYGEPRDHNLVCSIEIDCGNACCSQHHVLYMQTANVHTGCNVCLYLALTNTAVCDGDLAVIQAINFVALLYEVLNFTLSQSISK